MEETNEESHTPEELERPQQDESIEQLSCTDFNCGSKKLELLYLKTIKDSVEIVSRCSDCGTLISVSVATNGQKFKVEEAPKKETRSYLG